MKVEQMSMFGDGNGEYSDSNNGRKKNETVWYYVQKRDPPHRTLYTDSEGHFYYGEKDLLRMIPVLFSTAREARRVARNQKGQIKRYPYSLTM